MPYPLDTFYSRIYRRYDLINRLFTMGMDQLWRKQTARQCLRHNPAVVLDLCCGTGDLTIMLAKKSKKETSITGYDFNANMLERARQKIKKKQHGNISYIQGEVSQMPFADESFDCITIGFGFRNLTYENPERDVHMAQICRVLKKEGRFFILESGIPENRLIRFFFRLYLKLLLIPVGYLLSGDSQAYTYLARSASGFFSTDEIGRMLSAKGLSIVKRKSFFFGAANLIVARKP
ncbi:MAG: ubiquinone/menaquinone biosynthesis methyltransferase [Bacteroidales bacterium]|nr:ubiquinone/menaquinone biosynthesis methyltransferase [Bacteroidales bacterium]MBN2764704.1 ubiquinone/menaquinone biosynthesis methyltransferase [Bacteroidales bacterium]